MDQPDLNIYKYIYIFKDFIHTHALAGVAQRIERWPVNRGVAGAIPNWGTCLGRRPGRQ